MSPVLSYLAAYEPVGQRVQAAMSKADRTSAGRSGRDYPQRGEALFAALPDRFVFDELMGAAERLGISSEEAVEHLRIMIREGMLRLEEETFEKTGYVPAAS